MGIKQLYNDNLRKLPNEYGAVSVMNIKENLKKTTDLNMIINKQNTDLQRKLSKKKQQFQFVIRRWKPSTGMYLV